MSKLVNLLTKESKKLIFTMKVESCLSAFSISLCLAPQRRMKAFLLPVPWLLLQHLLPLHSALWLMHLL